MVDDADISSRKGKFRLKFDMIHKSPLTAQMIMGKCIIVRAEALWMHNSIGYEALSQMFDKVENCEVPPTYKIYCYYDLDAAKQMVFAERIDSDKPMRLTRKLNVSG